MNVICRFHPSGPTGFLASRLFAFSIHYNRWHRNWSLTTVIMVSRADTVTAAFHQQVQCLPTSETWLVMSLLTQCTL